MPVEYSSRGLFCDLSSLGKIILLFTGLFIFHPVFFLLKFGAYAHVLFKSPIVFINMSIYELNRNTALNLDSFLFINDIL